MKEGDLLPEKTGTATYANGTPIDITNATVTFIMTNCETDAVKINKAAVIVSGAAGTLKYVWNNTTTPDTDVAGKYRYEFKIIMPDTRIFRVPNDGYGRHEIQPKLA